jgi:hypothetical protein
MREHENERKSKYNVSINEEKQEITLCNEETGKCQIFSIVEDAFRKLFTGGKRKTRKMQNKKKTRKIKNKKKTRKIK